VPFVCRPPAKQIEQALRSVPGVSAVGFLSERVLEVTTSAAPGRILGALAKKGADRSAYIASSKPSQSCWNDSPETAVIRILESSGALLNRGRCDRRGDSSQWRRASASGRGSVDRWDDVVSSNIRLETVKLSLRVGC
jgi:hypothetical protein